MKLDEALDGESMFVFLTSRHRPGQLYHAPACISFNSTIYSATYADAMIFYLPQYIPSLVLATCLLDILSLAALLSCPDFLHHHLNPRLILDSSCLVHLRAALPWLLVPAVVTDL